jgi:threonine dehydratase
LSGAWVAGKAITPELAVFGVQSVGAPAMAESWKRRELLAFDRMQTFAEGIATRVAFELPAHILWDRLDGFVLVSDAELRRGIVTILEATHTVAEGAGAAGLAAAVQMRDRLAGKKVGCVVSGGNITLEHLKRVIDEERSW